MKHIGIWQLVLTFPTSYLYTMNSIMDVVINKQFIYQPVLLFLEMNIMNVQKTDEAPETS